MQNLALFPGLDLQSISLYLIMLFISSLRVGAFLIASPFFGSRMVPLPVRMTSSVLLNSTSIR